MHSDDMASACLFLLENYDGDEHVNVGTGTDLSIMDISTLIAELAGFDGITNWDISKPDGTPNKLLDVSKIESLGWSPKITMRAGLQQTMDWYKANKL
jgi:GDP-L-fucose synthase